jgi:predicted CXXCH cytochrome family protein
VKRLKQIILILAMLPIILWAQGTNTPNSCISCHENLEDALATPAKETPLSVHRHAELSCAGCHGGDPTADDAEMAMSRAKGFIGRPSLSQVPGVCSKCHSNAAFMRNYNPNEPVDQYERYLTSKHGQRWSKGDHLVAVCTSCHGVHDIRHVNDPESSVYPTKLADRCGRCHADADYMKPYSIATDQLQEYKGSVHGRSMYEKGDLGAPTCNDCHGNHGAMPPGIKSIANVCGLCHAVQAEYFSSSPHKVAFDEAGLSECEVCHGNHGIHPASDAMLGVGEGAVCIECHDESSTGYAAAKEMRATIDRLGQSIQWADSLQNRAQKAGVAVKDDQLQLVNARNQLTQARAHIHTFTTSQVTAAADKGMVASDAAVQIGQEALKELGHRRNLLVLLVVLTLLAAGFLILYIREHQHAGSAK